jgi:hypothetical protein
VGKPMGVNQQEKKIDESKYVIPPNSIKYRLFKNKQSFNPLMPAKGRLFERAYALAISIPQRERNYAGTAYLDYQAEKLLKSQGR